MQFPIMIGLRRSRILAGAVISVALLSSLVCIAYPENQGFKVPSVFLVTLVAVISWVKIRPDALGLRLERDGRISIARQSQHEYFPMALLTGATVHPWLLVLRLRDEDNHITTLIATVDSMAPNDFRRLRTFLRWRANFGAQPDA